MQSGIFTPHLLRRADRVLERDGKPDSFRIFPTKILYTIAPACRPIKNCEAMIICQPHEEHAEAPGSLLCPSIVNTLKTISPNRVAPLLLLVAPVRCWLPLFVADYPCPAKRGGA